MVHELYIAHFGHPLLKGARHWALLLVANPPISIAYQISGSTDTYAYKPPEAFDESLSGTGFMGKVKVGEIEGDHEARFVKTLQGVPITKGSLSWNCQDWVILALAALASEGFAVETPSKDQLACRLAEVAQ
ncbi:hypothetical protein FRC03_011388 [Tulasnella sp. 419]|nr:hypothetical protein FRC03_011388 [Tulasnella sp. 419]